MVMMAVGWCKLIDFFGVGVLYVSGFVYSSGWCYGMAMLTDETEEEGNRETARLAWKE